ncbi:beta-glucuronosyltransferase GlcAT14A-like [Quercus suber]|uniref:beta-glucuronosyltransferase GlcAT14A-like n=2 Tax=Quercus suber TaxID=58331 RepID=UPI0032E051CD
MSSASSNQSVVRDGADYEGVYPSGPKDHDVPSKSSPSSSSSSSTHEGLEMIEVQEVSDDEEQLVRSVVGVDGLREFILPPEWTVHAFTSTIKEGHFNTLRDRYQIPDHIPLRLPYKSEKCYYEGVDDREGLTHQSLDYVYAGSSFSVLSRNFIDFCILGTDNLPRTLLMYFANTPSSLSNYFPTILCNSHKFNRTVINNNLLYATFDKSSYDEPRLLSSSDFEVMIQSGAAFATRFKSDDPVLDRIDREILGRSPGNVVPGGWCLGESGNHTCSVWGDSNVLRPSLGARRLEKRIVELLSNGTFRSHHCVVE